MATRKRKLTVREVALRAGFRSGFEQNIAAQLNEAGVGFTFEEVKLEYEKPATQHKYTPDFQLENGIFIETKGRFLPDDRKKHLLVRDSNPDKDIRFVFQNSRTTISKGSKTSYGSWCVKNGFKYADKLIPEEWIAEKPAKK